MNEFTTNRNFMKSDFRLLQGVKTAQERGLPQPPLEKPYDPNGTIIPLPKPDPATVTKNNLYSCLKQRRSVRKFSDQALSLEELSFLLWATQGVQRVFGANYATYRPVPSAGARHPFETYLVINRVTGITPGIYRYLALSHQLLLLFTEPDPAARLTALTIDQPHVRGCAVSFLWSCLPERSEWRYHQTAHKTMLIDAGHLCQNLYLAGEATGCGVCAIGAYDQEALDTFLGLDGTDEFIVYMAIVGKR
ncbi:MAG TPA: SagB/ThcOx family dehydrogenase [Bacillota bacterium]|nr:SagB/ThcOx family dehydrogenase [Bacillota bacterium]